MRGPGYKTAGDVRRTWRCSHCGRERKLQGNVTTFLCGCQENAWMQIVAERISIPRPIQRPSDVERRPIDFGIEPAPPAPPKPESTIIKPAISIEPDPEPGIKQVTATETSAPEPPKAPTEPETTDDGWGDGILE